VSRSACAAVLGLALSVGPSSGAAEARPFVLHAEETGYRETGDFAEVERSCEALQRSHPRHARCVVFGTTPEGRRMRAVVASLTGALDAVRARREGRPVVLVIGGTHAGEIDGKDAGLALLRDLLASGESANPLREAIAVFVPVFNVDGHEHRGPNQRPNQDGPAMPGARTTARRINLNRDWMLAQSPEMRAMLGLVRRWDPLVTIDLHVTDGLRFRHDVALTVAPDHDGDEDLRRQAQAMREEVVSALTTGGHTPLPFYPRLKDVDDPGAGFVLDVDTPRLSHAYASLRNRVGVLVEDHAWDPYGKRVKTCRDTLEALLRAVVHRRASLGRAASTADAKAASLGGTRFPLAWDTAIEGGDARPARIVDIQGWRYEVTPQAPVVGGRHVVYDTTRPETWRVPLFDDVRPVSQVELPRRGYVVPAAWADVVAPQLDLHGVRYRKTQAPTRSVAVESMRVSDADVSFESAPFQGRQLGTVSGSWRPDTVDLPAGSLVVPLDQPLARLVAHFMEPAGPDSLSSWGLFHAAYETSDYVANHRAAELARWMHAGDERLGGLYGSALPGRLPQLKADFERRLSIDPAFAANPAARMAHWLDALPPQDPGLNVYPVMRLDAAWK
jgi:hypothetical protein